MQEAIITTETLETLTWPKRCPGCGQDVIEKATPHLDQQSVQQIRSNMESKDISELVKIWKENDRELYTEKTFEVVQKLLMERSELFSKDGLPSQKSLPEMAKFEECNVKVEKSVGAYFAGLKPKSLSVKLCTKCFKRASRFKAMESLGGVFGFLAIIGPIFLRTYTPQQMEGAGATFWIGALLIWLGGRGRKKAVGFRCKRLSKNKWKFSFLNDLYRNEFTSLNSSLMDMK